MKTEVYSWRVSSNLKLELARFARRRKVPISTLLEMALREWLAKNAGDIADDEDQKRLHAVAERYFAVVRGRDPRRPERVRADEKELSPRIWGPLKS